MATRQDYQIAADVCRFGNIVNDLLDAASYTARNINPDNVVSRISKNMVLLLICIVLFSNFTFSLTLLSSNCLFNSGCLFNLSIFAF